MLTYFIVSGLIMWAYSYIRFYCLQDKQVEDVIADITWECGVSREVVKVIFCTSGLLLGWIELPLLIIGCITALFKEGKE